MDSVSVLNEAVGPRQDVDHGEAQVLILQGKSLPEMLRMAMGTLLLASQCSYRAPQSSGESRRNVAQSF